MPTFTCNLCGAECKRGEEPLGRVVPSCTQCGSTVRLCALVALLSREVFGVELALPHTLGMRVFSEASLKGILTGAGFDEVHVAA